MASHAALRASFVGVASASSASRRDPRTPTLRRRRSSPPPPTTTTTTRASSSDASSSPSQHQKVSPSVRRPPPPPGHAEIAIRYAYPGVRFAQGNVVVVSVPIPLDDDDDDDDDDGAATERVKSKSLDVPASTVTTALASDGVDVVRWRPRVALSLPRGGHGGGGEDADAGWRRLRDDDVISFAHSTGEDAVADGLLVRLEDDLIAATAAPAAANRYAFRSDPTRYTRLEGSKGKVLRGGDEGDDDDKVSGQIKNARESGVTRRAASARGFWKLSDEGVGRVGAGNNPYAGASSDGTSVEPSSDLGAGYFGIGIVKPKHDANVGTLWRSAWQLGAAFIFTVAARYKHKYEASDTTQSHKQLPLHKHDDWGDFAKSSPHGAVLVAIEMGGTPLQDFAHPPRAVYVLGSEDNGLNRPIVEACQCHVALPKWFGRSASYNVAMAGTLVMYDRMIKQLWAGDAKAPSDGDVADAVDDAERADLLFAAAEAAEAEEA